MPKSIKLKNNTYLDSSAVTHKSTNYGRTSLEEMLKGKGIPLEGKNNDVSLGSDASSWICEPLYYLGAKKIFSVASRDLNTTDQGEFGLAYHDTKIYPYCDGYFYQQAVGYRCLDTSMVKLLWNNDTESWGDGKADIDISQYDFILVTTTNATTIVPADQCSGNLTWVGWYSPANADRASTRGFWKDGNGIKFDFCYGRGINGYTGWEQENDILVPRRIYGIKVW